MAWMAEGIHELLEDKRNHLENSCASGTAKHAVINFSEYGITNSLNSLT